MTGHGKVKALYPKVKVKTISDESKVFKTEIYLNTFLDDQIIMSQGEDTIYLETKEIPRLIDILKELQEHSENQSLKEICSSCKQEKIITFRTLEDEPLCLECANPLESNQSSNPEESIQESIDFLLNHPDLKIGKVDPRLGDIIGR